MTLKAEAEDSLDELYTLRDVRHEQVQWRSPVNNRNSNGYEVLLRPPSDRTKTANLHCRP
jgi:hypothetical protein